MVLSKKKPLWQELVRLVHAALVLVPDIVVEVAFDRVGPPNTINLIAHHSVPDVKRLSVFSYFQPRAEHDLPLNVEGGLLPLHLHRPGRGGDDRLAASLDQLDQLGVLDHPVGGGVP